MADPIYRAPGASSVPGVTYGPISPSFSAPGATARSRTRYAENLDTIRKAQDDYTAQQQQAEKAAQERASGGGAPLWMKGLGVLGSVMKYTTGNTYARKYVPGVAKAEDYIPGVKTALDIASNPLTYLPVGGQTSIAARLGLGLASAVGAGVGEQAGEQYAKTGLPGSKYAPLIGGLVGGIGTFQGGLGVMEKGLGGIPALGRFVPQDLKAVGVNEAFRSSLEAKAVARQAAKESADARTAGHALTGHTLYTQGDTGVFTYRKPTPVNNAIELTAKDLGMTDSLRADAANLDSRYVHGTVTMQDAYKIASSSKLDKGQMFHTDLNELLPGEVPIRIRSRYAKIDPTTGRMTQLHDLGAGEVQVYTVDPRSGDKAWKSIAGLVGDETKDNWRSVVVPSDEEGLKYVFDGDNWLYNKTPEEVAAQKAASAAAAYGVDTATGAARGSGQVTQTPPVPEGQMSLPGMNRFAAPPPAPAPVVSEGMRPLNVRGRPATEGQGIFEQPEHSRVQAVVQDTLDKSIEGGGGSSTNPVTGQPMRTGWGLSVNPERTQVIPAAQFEKDPHAALAQFSIANKDLLNDGEHYLGTWRDPATGNISLDVSVNPQDEMTAFAQMEHYNQKAMYDLNKGQVVENPKYDPTRGPEAMAAGTANEVAEAAPRIANPEVKAMADAYNTKAGLMPLPKETPYLEADPVFMKKVADSYETMPVDTPEVKTAYKAFGEEIHAQFLDAQEKGITFKPQTDTSITEIYPTAQAMRDDVANNKNLLVNTGGTTQGELERVMPDTGWTLNNEFRAIHDLYGHAKEGMDFGPRGEFNASYQHSLMFSPEAQKAMLSETLGQTAWGNFHSPGVRAGTEPFVFAEQRAGILPDEIRNEFYAQFTPAETPGAGLPTQNMTLTHYGPKQLSEINPQFQGTGIAAAETAKQGINPNEQSRFASYYEQGVKPEKQFVNPKTGVQSAGMVKHTITGDYKVLDLNSPEGKAFRLKTGADVNGHYLDDALQQAGYDGYKVGDQGTVRMFGKQAVATVNDVPVVKEVPTENSVMRIAADGSAEDVAFGAKAAPETPAVSSPSPKVQRTGLSGEANPRARLVNGIEQNPVTPEDILGGKKSTFVTPEETPMTSEESAAFDAREKVLDEYMNYQRGSDQYTPHKQGETEAEFLARTVKNEQHNTLTGGSAQKLRQKASEVYGGRGIQSEDAGRKLFMSLFEDEHLPDPRGRQAEHGMLYGKGAANEAGNFLPDTVKKLYADGKILNGGKGTKSVQDILGKMLAADFLLHGSTNEDAFAQFGRTVKEQFGIDLKEAASGKGVEAGAGNTLEDFVKLRANHYVNQMLQKPRYNGDLANMKRLTGLLLSADPQSGKWYEGTLPAVYDLFGEEDGNTFLKFLAITSQQKTPRDNIQLALDTFADYKLGYFKDPEYVPFGMPAEVSNRLRYAAEGGEPTGMKINAFHGSLTLDDFNAPVDRWMFRIFGFDDAAVASAKNVHEIIAQQMRIMADELGMTPREVQARLWVAARNESEGANVINEPFEELMLGSGKYTNTGKLAPDLEGNAGLPTAKQTLQHILDMRDKGLIDLPHDTKVASAKAQALVDETQAFRQGKVQVSMESALARAKDAGVPVTPGEDAATILDRVSDYQGEIAKGPVFSPADAARDAERQAAKQQTFAGWEPNPEEIAQYDPTAMAARNKELDDWSAAGALDHHTLPDDLANVRDNFRARVEKMTPDEAAMRFGTDARTPEWQKTVLKDMRPNDVERVTEAADAGVQATRLATLKDDLRKAKVPEEKIDEIAQKALGTEQATEAGQAIRGVSRAESLYPNPYGAEAYARARAADAPKVNGRPVISMTGQQDFLSGTGTPDIAIRKQASDSIEKTIAESTWAPAIDQQFADAVDRSVAILERGPYRVGGTGPKAGGLYYKSGEIGFYNDVTKSNAPGTQNFYVQAERAATTIHLNPVTMFEQAQRVAKREGVPLHQALADETLETALHETAHDLAYHTANEWAVGRPKDEQFLRVLNDMKANGAQDIEAQRARMRADFQKMDADGTLVKWENDNARIRRTDREAGGRYSIGGIESQLPNPKFVGTDVARNAESLPEQIGAGLGRSEGVPSGVAGRGREPGAGIQSIGGTAESRLAAAAGLPEHSPRAIERTGLNGERTEPINPRGRTADEPGAPGQPNATRITTPAPRLLEKAGDGKVFETALPAGERISAAPRSMEEVGTDIFKNNVYRKAAERIGRTNALVKRVLTTVAGKAGTAETNLEKDIAIYAVKTDVDKSRIVGMMAELRQAKRPFDKLADNLTNAVDWRGKAGVFPLGDVLSHPNNFILSKAQEGYISRYHKIVDELVGDAKAQGIDIKELDLVKGEGSHYVPRWVQGAEGVDIEGRYAKGGLGAKQKFDRTRYHDTEASGYGAGVQYHDSEQALQGFAEAIMKRTRDKEIIDRVRQYGRTASELVGPEARLPLDAQVIKLRVARTELNATTRDLAKLKGADIAVQAGRKTLSPADIRSMVSENADVKAAKSALDEIKSRRSTIQDSLDAAKTPEGQARWDLRLDAIKGKQADAEDALKAARKQVREHVTSTDQSSVAGAKLGSKAQVKAATERVAAAQARYDSVFTGTKQAKSDYSRILTAKKSVFRESGEKFGMEADVIPVRQSRELPGLQGRIFPSEVMDVLERGLADKGSTALVKLASANDLARMFTTSTDFGATMLQGLPVLAYNPRAWAKATITSIHAFFDPQVLQRYYATNRQVANEMSNWAGGLSTNEFFHSAVGGESIVGKAAKSATPLISAPAQAVERFGVSFDTFLDVAKLEMWKSLSPLAKGDTGKLEELGRFIRNVTGTTSTARLGASTTQRQVESLLMFSPRFTRSVFALGSQAFERGAGGAQARKALGGLILGSMALYAGIKTTLNKGGITDEPFNWKDFDPTSGGRFMSIKVGDNYIGLGGSMRGAIQLLGMAESAAVSHPERFLSTDTTSTTGNPFLKYIRGRSSPLAGEGWNLLTGKDAIGQEYDGRKEWLAKLPDTFVPFAVQSIAETEGGTGSKFGVFAAQTVGLRTFPETKNENLAGAMKDKLSRMATDIPGFSQAERDEIASWADLTKYQKMILLQRAPELRQQLDPKEAQFWTGYKQVQADADAAKRDLGQQLLTTMRKQTTGEKMTADDLTPEQYRNAIADVAMKQRAAEASLKGANAITGLGGDFSAAGGPRTHRQVVMHDFYQTVDGKTFVDPVTGQVDFNKKDELESTYLAALPKADQDIISQEKGAEYDAMARELKSAKLAIAPYWNIGDSVAQRLGFQNAQELDVSGTAFQQKRYNSLKGDMQERFRRAQPEIDQLLVRWGYVGKSIFDRATGGGGGGKLGVKLGRKLGIKRIAL